MSFYQSPADMYASRADRFKRDGDQHWAMAKNGEGGFHYGKARFCYEQAAVNRAKAEQARVGGSVFRKGHAKGKGVRA